MNTCDDPQDESSNSQGIPQPVLAYAQHKASPIVIVWCRLLALVMFGYGIEQVTSFVGYLLLELSRGMRLQFDISLESAVVAAVWPVLGWYCWSHAPELAERIVRGSAADTQDDPARSHTGDEILSSALLTLGAYEFVEGIPLLVRSLSRSQKVVHSLADLPWAEMADPLVRLGIGALLIFGNRMIGGYLRRVSGRDSEL